MRENSSPTAQNLSPSPSFSIWSPAFRSKNLPKSEVTPTSQQIVEESNEDDTDSDQQGDKPKSKSINTYRKRLANFLSSIFSTMTTSPTRKRDNKKPHNECFPTILRRKKNFLLAIDNVRQVDNFRKSTTTDTMLEHSGQLGHYGYQEEQKIVSMDDETTELHMKSNLESTQAPREVLKGLDDIPEEREDDDTAEDDTDSDLFEITLYTKYRP